MASALEIVKGVYDCFAKEDIDGFLALCDENIEWVVNGPASLEKCTSFKGHQGVRQFLDILGNTWEFNSFDTKQFITQDNIVVVLGEETGIDLKTGKAFENRWSHVFDVSNGKVIRFREFLCHWLGDEKAPAMNW